MKQVEIQGPTSNTYMMLTGEAELLRGRVMLTLGKEGAGMTFTSLNSSIHLDVSMRNLICL